MAGSIRGIRGPRTAAPARGAAVQVVGHEGAKELAVGLVVVRAAQQADDGGEVLEEDDRGDEHGLGTKKRKGSCWERVRR